MNIFCISAQVVESRKHKYFFLCFFWPLFRVFLKLGEIQKHFLSFLGQNENFKIFFRDLLTFSLRARAWRARPARKIPMLTTTDHTAWCINVDRHLLFLTSNTSGNWAVVVRPSWHQITQFISIQASFLPAHLPLLWWWHLTIGMANFLTVWIRSSSNSQNIFGFLFTY